MLRIVLISLALFVSESGALALTTTAPLAQCQDGWGTITVVVKSVDDGSDFLTSATKQSVILTLDQYGFKLRWATEDEYLNGDRSQALFIMASFKEASETVFVVLGYNRRVRVLCDNGESLLMRLSVYSEDWFGKARSPSEAKKLAKREAGELLETFLSHYIEANSDYEKFADD